MPHCVCALAVFFFLPLFKLISISHIFNPPSLFHSQTLLPHLKMFEKLVLKSSYRNRSLRYECHCGIDASLMTTWTDANPGCHCYGCGIYKVWLPLCYFCCSSRLSYIATEATSLYSFFSSRCKVTRNVATLFGRMKKWTQGKRKLFRHHCRIWMMRNIM